MPALRTRDTQVRSLEVTTDVPQPPTFAIISPTPRAFTFPISHNFTDSPISTPSHSPFEPELLQTSTSPILRTLSPVSPIVSPSSPSSSSHQRRKSSCSTISADDDRRPRKGDSDYIKRPENAFILFRRKCCEERQALAEGKLDGPTKKQRQADLSKTISQQWKSLSAEERKVWENKAKERKKEHEQLYPNYVYRPQRSKDRAKGKKIVKGERKDEFEHETGAENLSFVIPLPVPPRHGRSASAPTPPPYQSIVLPNVYHMAPSCPTTPSLLPMISRRASHTTNVNGDINNFDFLPNDNFMPPSFGQAGQYEASLQSSEFLRNIFAMPNMSSVSQKNDQPQMQLTVPRPHEILSQHQQVISPASSVGSSGPSSPALGPYTTITSHSFTQQLAAAENPDMQLQHDLSDYTWESSSIWPNTVEMLMGDDFDLNAIPPIELGYPKYNDDHLGDHTTLNFEQDFTHALEGHQFQQEHIVSFDDMMAGHRY